MRKFVLIGLDSVVPNLIFKFVKEGSMPYIENLMKKSCYGRAIPSFPTHTPTNWTTIATGADVSIHKVNVFDYNTNLRKAESIWQAAERQGKSTILLRYPGTWPRDFSKGIIFDHGGNLPSKFRIAMAQVHIRGEKVKYVGGLHGTQESMEVEFKKANGWKNLPSFEIAPMESEILIMSDDNKKLLSSLHILLIPEKRRYKKLLISKDKNFKNSLCTLCENEWSDYVILPFNVNGNKIKCGMRFKLIELSPDGKKFKLYRSEIYPVEGFNYPERITKELSENCGIYVGTPGRILLGAGWMETYFEEARDHVDWLVKAANYLFKNKKWDIFMMECHFPDFIQHKFWSFIDPESEEYNPYQGWNILRTTYKLLDKLISGITENLDSNTLICIVSDHGHCLRWREVLTVNALTDAGLINPWNPEKSKIWIEDFNIFVNLKNGRKKKYFGNGTVEKKEYESIRNKVIKILSSIVDKEKDIFPVAMVLKDREVPILGMSENIVGDLVFCLRCGYESSLTYVEGVKKGYYLMKPRIGKWGTSGGTHGMAFPTSTYSIGEMYSFFLLCGKDIKRNFYLPYPIHLKDIIPTACKFLNVLPPVTSNGLEVKEVFEK